MQKNVGGIDKGARIAAGCVLCVLALGDTIGPWGWIGLVPLLTGLFGHCPLYPLLGMTTCRTTEGNTTAKD